MSKAVFVNSMKENRSGNIINLSARTAETGAALMTHANAAKAGVEALSKVLAVEWGPYGVRVNTLTPGYIRETLGYRKLGAATFTKKSKKSVNPDPNDKDFATDQNFDRMPIPAQRMGSPLDITNSALFLASPASEYITGWNTVVDGGAQLTSPNLFFNSPGFT